MYRKAPLAASKPAAVGRTYDPEPSHPERDCFCLGLPSRLFRSAVAYFLHDHLVGNVGRRNIVNSFGHAAKDIKCRECYSIPGQPCVALRGAKTGRPIGHFHVSRQLYAVGKCEHGYKPENCGLCAAL